MNDRYRSGFVAIIGKPNVGKSTLMNHLVGQKISITSRRPQTTRHRLLGIDTHDKFQIVFVDTPGLHPKKGKLLNRYMNRAARTSLADVDCILFLLSTTEGWTEQDEYIIKLLTDNQVPVVLVLNKIDRLADKSLLLRQIEELHAKHSFAEIVPVSALKNSNLDRLVDVIRSHLPYQERLYAEDYITDKSERFQVAELIREQIFRQIGQEIPYSIAIEIEEFKESKTHYNIVATVFVEKPSQKNILVGKNGSRIKKIGSAARKNIEKQFGKKVHLETWVKVREKWADNVQTLKSLGYGESE